MVWVKRALSLILLGIVLYLFWPLLKEIRAAAGLFREANWAWFGAAILIQVISYAFLTWLNVLALKPFPGRITFWKLAATLTSMAFIEVAIPSGGVSGMALRARLLGKQGGYSVEASTSTLAIETIILSIAMASAGLLGLVYLLERGQVSENQLASLGAAGLGLAMVIVTAWRLAVDPRRSRVILAWVVGMWNRRLSRIRTLDAAALETRLSTFQSSLGQLKYVPRWMFFLAAYGRVALDVATLGLCFWMFGHPVTPGTLLTGYGLILLMSGLALLPGGLGLADASVPVIFAGLGVTGSVALAAGLTYRLIAFWLLRLVGFVSWQILEAKK